MFFFAKDFNCDISNWDVSRVKEMDCMFCSAGSFTQKLCGAAWVHSKASKSDMFQDSRGFISRTVCTPASTPPVTINHYVSRRPIPERELIVRTPITTSVSTSAFTSAILSTVACSKCGTFTKSRRVSCCAPGGAWYKNCGGANNKNVDHMWSEGAAACKRTSNANGML